jgi:hypothetical protein
MYLLLSDQEQMHATDKLCDHAFGLYWLQVNPVMSCHVALMRLAIHLRASFVTFRHAVVHLQGFQLCV